MSKKFGETVTAADKEYWTPEMLKEDQERRGYNSEEFATGNLVEFLPGWPEEVVDRLKAMGFPAEERDRILREYDGHFTVVDVQRWPQEEWWATGHTQYLTIRRGDYTTLVSGGIVRRVKEN